MGIVVLLAASTLTQVLVIFTVPLRLPSMRRYLELVGTYSVIGVILGLALSFRGAMHLFLDAGRDASRYGLPEFLSTVSDDVTLATLVMVAACWWHTPMLFRDLAATIKEKVAHREVRIRGMGWGSALLILLSGNYIGLQTAFFAYQLLTRYP
ncbi:hypothetical protein AB0G04_38270 [Actinoplanes sp. NPDC023801]|uniref:hypothetical protein n=1 Tax=Actinoplanes sp. NPDC023801 TaxID=3154595 RepID=UPI0033D7F7F5